MAVSSCVLLSEVCGWFSLCVVWLSPLFLCGSLYVVNGVLDLLYGLRMVSQVCVWFPVLCVRFSLFVCMILSMLYGFSVVFVWFSLFCEQPVTQ